MFMRRKRESGYGWNEEEAGARGGISIIAIDEPRSGEGEGEEVGSLLLCPRLQLSAQEDNGGIGLGSSLWAGFEAGFCRFGFGSLAP